MKHPTCDSSDFSLQENPYLEFLCLWDSGQKVMKTSCLMMDDDDADDYVDDEDIDDDDNDANNHKDDHNKYHHKKDNHDKHNHNKDPPNKDKDNKTETRDKLGFVYCFSYLSAPFRG